MFHINSVMQGLGKTVEVLALVLSNPAPQQMPPVPTRTASGLVISRREQRPLGPTMTVSYMTLYS